MLTAHHTPLGSRLRDALKSVASAEAIDEPGTPSLEITTALREVPRIKNCTVIEDERMCTHSPVGMPAAAFGGFLDGVQESHSIAFVRGVPLVLGRVAAVIRVRHERRMMTWSEGSLRDARLYVPRRLLDVDALGALEQADVPLVDTLGTDELPSAHPYELLQRAVHSVQQTRERLERDLAERWCERETAPLYVDGGLPRGERSSQAECCVGVVKSHHTLYASGDDMRTVLALPIGTRSSVFILERQWGATVASWNLRLRDPRGHDPIWGLVRVETAYNARDNATALASRADQVSQWILAERSPLALPDGRWDAMAYGIRDCEMYLRSEW